jgi:signal transduction histidine kinase
VKLFTKYNRISIAALTLVFIVSCIAFYIVLRYVLITQLDDTLHTEQTEIVSYVKEHNRLPEIMNAYNQRIDVIPVQAPPPRAAFSSRKIINDEKKEEWVRQLEFGITAAGAHYRVVVTKSQMETNDLLQLVIFIGAGMMALVLLAGYGVNRIVIKQLWKPFYTTLQEVEQYQLAKQQPMQLPVSNISEFDLLNQQLRHMTERAQQDYQVVKEFSANAAHEMQTPLAVIQSHTEALMQDERLLHQHNTSIQTIEQSVQRLTRLNQALLLLARIENRQFLTNETMALDALVKEKTTELAELIASKKITLDVQTTAVNISFNRHLTEAIIQNLLNNAIRYNVPGGKIGITLTQAAFSIANTSAIPALEPEKISRRFYRHPQTQADGNGLGLSIVQQVCNWAGYRLHYNYKNAQHVFVIDLRV